MLMSQTRTPIACMIAFFLVCDACGQTLHLDDDKITRDVRSVASAAGFSPKRPVIEVRGRCADCG